MINSYLSISKKVYGFYSLLFLRLQKKLKINWVTQCLLQWFHKECLSPAKADDKLRKLVFFQQREFGSDLPAS